MLTAGEIASLRDASEELTAPIIAYLLRDLAERIAAAGEFTATAQYETWKLQQLGVSQKEIKKELQKLLKSTNADIERLMTQSAKAGYSFDLKMLPTVEAIPFEKNAAVQQIVAAAVALAQDDLTNITQTLGMIDPYGNAQPLQAAYRQCMDYAFMQVSTGAADYNTAIRAATKNLADKGVYVIDYESGVHTTLEAAVRRNIMGGLGLMQEQISKRNHDDMGADGWEIDAHSNSAPDHEPIQGKQYPDAEYEALNNSLVRRIGTLNCGHSAYPIIMGISSPQYTPEQLEAMREANEKGITYNGKHYTGYEATQRQRALETAIRKQKRRILIDETTGDAEKLEADQIKLQMLRQEYKRFSKATGLRTQTERAKVAGFGRKQASAADKAYRNYQSTLEKSTKSGIIKYKEMFKRKSLLNDGASTISDKRFNELTIEARKNGATILKGTPEVEKHLKDVGATASTIGDTLLFRSNPTIGEVLEETHHFMQNLSGLNDDKPEPLRTILNEIDAKEYIISNASKFGVPRLEIKLAEEEREYYRKLLSEYEGKN